MYNNFGNHDQSKALRGKGSGREGEGERGGTEGRSEDGRKGGREAEGARERVSFGCDARWMVDGGLWVPKRLYDFLIKIC